MEVKTLVVEYLIILKQEDTFCDSDKAFLKFLAVDSRLDIAEKSNKITLSSKKDNKFSVSYLLLSGLVPSKKERYFKLTLTSNESDKLNEFDELTNLLEKIITKLHTEISINVLWNDIARQYAIEGYGLINEVENLLRRLITNFMLINVGYDWHIYEVPIEVQKRNPNLKGNYSDYLHTKYFIDLKTILFEGQRDSNFRNIGDIQKFIEKSISEKKTEIPINEFAGVVSKSLWEKNFSKNTDYKKKDLEDDLVKLNDLRNEIAHNRHIKRENLGKIQSLSKKVIKTLKLEIEDLPNKNLTPEERKFQIDFRLEEFADTLQKALEEKTVDISEDEADDLVNNVSGNTTFIKKLFSNGHLRYGDKIYYNPANEQTGKKYVATVKTEGKSRCLSIEADDKSYSFSGLRKKIVKDLELKDIKPNWGFNLWNEWVTEAGIPLSSYNTPSV